MKHRDDGHLRSKLIIILQTAPDKCRHHPICACAETFTARASPRFPDGASNQAEKGYKAQKYRGGIATPTDDDFHDMQRPVECHYDHSLFCLTLRATSVGGFLMTIQSIIDVAAASAYLISVSTRKLPDTGGRGVIPCKYILSVIIPQIDLRRPSNRNTTSLSIPRSHEIWCHGLFHPHSLAPRQRCHLRNIRKVELLRLWAVIRREHVLLPGLS